MAIESKMNRGPIGRSASTEDKKKPGSWMWIGTLLFVAVVGGAWYYFSDSQPSDVVDSMESAGDISISSGEYQAVFLSNGQVYFGKLEPTRGDFAVLTDVFYLQSGVAVDQNTNLSLTKLGSEAHGPEDRMEINKEHILFIEDMKNDSKVVQAIEAYKSKK